MNEKRPLNLFAQIGSQHPGRLCLSLGAEGRNLTVFEYGDQFSQLGKDKMVAWFVNECVGDQDSIKDFFIELKSEKFTNIQASEVHYAYPYTQPTRIEGTDKFWARIHTTFKYKSAIDGSFPHSLKLGLEGIGAVVISDGKEYAFFKSEDDLRYGDKWSNLKEKIADPNVYANPGELTLVRVNDNDLTNKQLRMARMLPGALSFYPGGGFLKPDFLHGVILDAEAIFLRKDRYRSGILDELGGWPEIQQEVFLQMYNRGYLRPRISDRSRSLAQFHRELKQSKHELGKHPYTTIKVYADRIQETLDSLHELYVATPGTGIESDLLYSILSKADDP
jgi:hypothetical protein